VYSSNIFPDLRKLNYEDYMHIVKRGPYRGTEAYPLGSRRYSYRHFIVTDEGVVQVWYGHLRSCDTFRKHKVGSSYLAFRHLLNVYPDNTFEIVNAGNNGENMLISCITNSWVHRECKRGGTVISDRYRNTSITHPVFKGLRLSLNDLSLHSDSQYKLRYKKIIPSAKKATMAEYANQLQIGEAMLSAMERDGMDSLYRELNDKVHDRFIQEHNKRSTANFAETRAQALYEARQANYNLDVLMYTAMAGGFSGRMYSPDANRYKQSVINATKQGIYIYLKSRPEIFTYVYREPNDFPTSATWGMDVVIDNKPVIRY